MLQTAEVGVGLRLLDLPVQLAEPPAVRLPRRVIEDRSEVGPRGGGGWAARGLDEVEHRHRSPGPGQQDCEVA